MTTQLPPAFADLEPWTAWSLATEGERYAKRAASTIDDLRAFSEALTPRMHDVIGHLTGFAWGTPLPPADERLYHMGLSYMEATIPLDLAWKSPVAEDSYPVTRLKLAPRT